MPYFSNLLFYSKPILDISLLIRQSGSRLCWRATCQE